MEVKKDYKGVLVFALILAIVFMSVGYAALSQRLTVTGTATVGDANWDVKITSIAFDAANSNITASNSETALDPEEEAVGAGSTGATFDVTLNAPGDKAVYTVVVTNKGTIPARLSEITNIATVNNADPKDIKFTVTPAAGNTDTLATNGTHTYTITASWDADSTVIPEPNQKTATINFDYVQAN